MKDFIVGSFCTVNSITTESYGRYCSVVEIRPQGNFRCQTLYSGTYFYRRNDLTLFPFQVGDVCEMAEAVVDRFAIGDKVKISNFAWGGTFDVLMVYVYHAHKDASSGTYGVYFSRLKPKEQTNVQQCTCDNFSLFNSGCKCGYIEFERTQGK